MPEAEGALTEKGFKLTGNVFHLIKDRWKTALGVFAAFAAALYVIAPAPFACIFSRNCIEDAFHGAGAQERATLFALFRITKTWTTDQDLSRNQRQLIAYLNSLSSEKRTASALVPGADDETKKEAQEKAQEKFDEWNTFMEKLIWELQTPDLSPGRDNVILTVIYRGNPEDNNALCDILSKLPDALYAAQDGVRTGIQAELVRIAARLGASEDEAKTMQWKPGEKYSPGLVADYRNKWHQLKTKKCEGLLVKPLVPPPQTPAATTAPTVTPQPATPVAKSPVTAPAVTPPTTSSTTPPRAGSDTSETKEGEPSILGPGQTPK